MPSRPRAGHLTFLAFLAGAQAMGQERAPVGTAFTFQGRLTVDGSAVTGTYDFSFELFTDPSGGSPLGNTLLRDDVPVTDGLFTVLLSFGGQFDGSARYVQSSVRTGTSTGSYTVLAPRQALSATPYAIYALGIPLSGSGSASTAAHSDHEHDAAYWKQGGNSGTTAGMDFLGTTDSQALELKVNNARIVRLEPETAFDGPNLIGGYSGNSVTAGVIGATIGGGGDPDVAGTVFPNKVTDNYCTVGGGSNNLAGDNAGIVGDNSFATVAGGFTNAARLYGTVGGGYYNKSTGEGATLGGGGNNTAGGSYATIGGGQSNTASGDDSTVGGGQSNTASGDDSTVGGGRENQISGGSSAATVGGGYLNVASGLYPTISGGYSNTASENFATVGGGQSNTASGDDSTVSGGTDNIASGSYATVPGGLWNSAAGYNSFAAGYRAKADHQGSFVWGDATNAEVHSLLDNQFRVRANGGVRFDVNNDKRVILGDFSGNLITTNIGASLTIGGTWTNASDRALKRDFASVDARNLLERLSTMPIQSWSYKSEPPTVRHIGPSAQDFHAAFGLGHDDKHLGTLDAEGVALAAIQALYGLLQEKEAKIAALEADRADQFRRNEALEARLAAVEKSLGALQTVVQPSGSDRARLPQRQTGGL